MFIASSRSVVVLCLLVLAVALGCGPSQEEIDQRIAEAVAASEARVLEQSIAAATELQESVGRNFSTMDDRLAAQDAAIVENRHHIDTTTVELKGSLENATTRFENYADNAVLVLQNRADADLLANRQYTDISAREAADALRDAQQDFHDLAQDTLTSVKDRLNELTPSICESNYWSVVLWVAYWDLVDALETRGGRMTQADFDQLNLWANGLIIGNDYADYSLVCDVDRDGTWYLLEQAGEVEHTIDR